MEQNVKLNIQLEQNEETAIQGSKERLMNLWGSLKCSNIRIIWVPEGEEEDQEIENLFEQIMKENFPNLVNEMKSRKPRESQKSWTQRGTHQGTSSLSYPR